MLEPRGWTLRSLAAEASLVGIDPAALADIPIEHVCDDSRSVRAGSCFVAVRGVGADGHDYVDDAVRAGAAAVVVERSVWRGQGRPLHQSFPGLTGARIVEVEDSRGALARLSAAVCGVGRATREGRLRVVGVTGTNGKSTTCYLVQSILKAAGHPTALLGTIRYDLVGETVAANWTTPPATALAELLRRAMDAGATHAVMETSSHALDQRRCDGLSFAAGVFTNLTGDHLDYHRDAESYFTAKKRLFDGLPGGAVAVVNGEDPRSRAIVSDCAGRVLRYGLEGGDLDIGARDVRVTTAGSRFRLRLMHGEAAIDSPLIGRHNVMNMLAAAGAAEALGVEREAIRAGLEAVRIVPGRLQRVETNGAAFSVLVDYAHTDDALVNVLSVLRPLTKGRLICVFGCGGDRDRTKRPRMAAAAARFADLAIVTSDNPRTEDPDAIIAEILRGFERAAGSCQVEVEADRRTAIGLAIEAADAGDTVLIAGKGHEDYQILGSEKVHFDDVDVAGEWVRGRV